MLKVLSAVQFSYQRAFKMSGKCFQVQPSASAAFIGRRCKSETAAACVSRAVSLPVMVRVLGTLLDSWVFINRRAPQCRLVNVKGSSTTGLSVNKQDINTGSYFSDRDYLKHMPFDVKDKGNRNLDTSRRLGLISELFNDGNRLLYNLFSGGFQHLLF